MEAEYVYLRQIWKEPLPIINLVKGVASEVGLEYSEVMRMHTSSHKDNYRALILENMEPLCMTPRYWHYADKYKWFIEILKSNNTQ